MMLILVKSGQKWKTNVRSGRPRLITACMGVNGLKWNYKSQKQFLLKKVAVITWIHQILNLFDHEQYVFIFFLVMIWSLCWMLCFKNLIDVRQWMSLVSPGKSLLLYPSPKFPQFISPLQSGLPQPHELTMANLILASKKMAWAP